MMDYALYIIKLLNQHKQINTAFEGVHTDTNIKRQLR